jgi:phosphoglycolate phosphatase
MIGDTKYDINGAKAAGVRSIGVLYGYGTEAELREAGADHICPTVASVGELLA